MFVYDCDTKEWTEVPDEPMPEPLPDIPQEPTQEDRIEAQVLYTALMTDTLLEG